MQGDRTQQGLFLPLQQNYEQNGAPGLRRQSLKEPERTGVEEAAV
ncbi:hypothetical protein [Pontibacter ummariensis]|nr:hypothetical protein [Pontibacter ummariensis]